MTEKVKQHAAPVTGSDEIDIGRLVGTVIEALSSPRRFIVPTHWYKSNKTAAIR